MRVLLLVMGLFIVTACVTTQEDSRGKPLPQEPTVDQHEVARAYTELGAGYARQGQYDVAQEKLQRALQAIPDYAPAIQTLAFVYAQRGDNPRAEEYYKRSLQLNPRDPNTLNNFGVFLCARNRVPEGEKYLLRAAADPDYREPEHALINAAVCVRKVPDLARAEAHLREALRRKPDSVEGLQQMASLCLERNDFLRARAFLQRYEKLGPPTPQTLWIGAQVEAKLGNPAGADEYGKRLKTEFPESEESASITLSPAS